MIPEEYRLIALFIIAGALLVFLIWGRYRYDVVAFGALVITVLAGIVPEDKAFEGFGHPATIIIALVLVASHGLTNSGAVNLVVPFLIRAIRGTSSHIAIMGGIGAALSTIMNNVGALALLMPVDLQTAEKAQRSPAPTLMPLSFATILGGLVTLMERLQTLLSRLYASNTQVSRFKCSISHRWALHVPLPGLFLLP